MPSMKAAGMAWMDQLYGCAADDDIVAFVQLIEIGRVLGLGGDGGMY